MTMLGFFEICCSAVLFAIAAAVALILASARSPVSPANVYPHAAHPPPARYAQHPNTVEYAPHVPARAVRGWIAPPWPAPLTPMTPASASTTTPLPVLVRPAQRRHPSVRTLHVTCPGGGR